MKDAIEQLSQRVAFLEFEYIKSQAKDEITYHVISSLFMGQEKSKEIEKVWRMIDNNFAHDMIERYKKHLVSPDKQKDISDFIGSEIIKWKQTFDVIINEIHKPKE